MTFLVRGLLPVLLGVCVVLAAAVLIPELISLGRKLRAKATPKVREENRTTRPSLPELESELE